MIPTIPNASSSFDAVNPTIQTTRTAPSKPVDSAEDEKLKKAAGDFESILLASLWKGMRDSFGSSEGNDADPAHGTLDDWGIEVMSGAVGKAGGLGIGRLILDHLEPAVNAQDAQPGATAHNPASPAAGDKGK